MKKRALYIEAILKWGEQSQIKMAMEECVELVHALLKLDRNINAATNSQVLEEMADVEIMLEQLKIIFDYNQDGCSVFEQFKNMKLKRLEKRLRI